MRDRYQSSEQMIEDLRQAFHIKDRIFAPLSTATIEEETVVRPAVTRTQHPEPRRQNYTLYLAVTAVVFGLLAVIGSAVALARLSVQNREEFTQLTGKSSSEKRRQSSINKVAPLGTGRVRTLDPPAIEIPMAPNPTESPSTPVNTADVPGTFPEASTRLLTPSDLVNRSQWELRVMRNEIFARHGYIFKTLEMHNYFTRQQWYSPRHADVSEYLSTIEARNVKFLRISE